MAETFNKEAPFEVALVEALRRKGWGQQPVLMYPTEADLIENWRHILSKINNGIDCLNGCPLTDGEMQQVLQQVRDLRSPLRLNSEFINGKSISLSATIMMIHFTLGKLSTPLCTTSRRSVLMTQFIK